MSRRPPGHRLRNYRSSDPAAGLWWKRGADPVGPHSLAAFTLGIALVAVIGVAFDPLNVTTDFDLPDVERQAHEEAYEDAHDEAWDKLWEPYMRETLVELALEADNQRSDWVTGVREGWTDGWNQALDALLEASEAHAPADERDRELGVIRDALRR